MPSNVLGKRTKCEEYVLYRFSRATREDVLLSRVEMTGLLKVPDRHFDSKPLEPIYLNKYEFVRNIKDPKKNGGTGTVHEAELKKADGILHAVAVKRRWLIQAFIDATKYDTVIVRYFSIERNLPKLTGGLHIARTEGDVHLVKSPYT